MIPLYKLEKLPRNQQLRKIAKYFSMAENRWCLAPNFSKLEIIFFMEASNSLTQDNLFSQEAQKVFKEATDTFQRYMNDSTLMPADDFHRALNTVKHLLFMTIGRDQADWDFIGNDGQLDAAKRQVFKGMTVYLEDIRSPFNVGSIFRTAESFGVEKIFLSPFCADPNHVRAKRTAMGCIDIIPWERYDFFSKPENLPFPVFALETGGIPINEFPFPQHGLLIAGSEELGVSPRALAAADASLGRVSIPCFGVKASLNVSVAFGIAIQTWARYLALQH